MEDNAKEYRFIDRERIRSHKSHSRVWVKNLLILAKQQHVLTCVFTSPLKVKPLAQNVLFIIWPSTFWLIFLRILGASLDFQLGWLVF
jgi:hypothetical protein